MSNQSQPDASVLSKISDQLSYFMQKAQEQLALVDSPQDLIRFLLYPSGSSPGS
jgi:hypothetical protein